MADLIKRKFKVFKLICILLVLNNQNASGETSATFSDRENRDRAVRLLLFPTDDKGGGTNFLDVSDEPRSLFRRSTDDNPTSDLEAADEKNEAKKLKRRKKKKLLRKKKKVGRRADRKKR